MSHNDQAARDAVLDLVHVQSPDIDPLGRIFIPSRAATPEPYSPRSRPVQLRTPTDRASPQPFEPYPTPSSSPARKRVRPAGSKRSMNAFIIYRREFPARYPHIDALERHQGPKSSIIGAMWRAEPLEVKEYFFRLQAAADEEFRRTHGTADAPRADPVKTLMRRERARQRRTRDEKLAPRSELIVKLWAEKKSTTEFIRAVHEYDEQCKATAAKPEPKLKIVMSSSPLSNHTNTPMDSDGEVQLLPSTSTSASTAGLELQTDSFIVAADASALSGFPGDSPVLRTPSPAPALESAATSSDDMLTSMHDGLNGSLDHLSMLVPQDIDMYFGNLLELIQPLDAYSPVGQPAMHDAFSDADAAFMSQLFPASSFPEPAAPMWHPDGAFGGDLLPPFGEDTITTGWDAYTHGAFDIERASGVYALGLGCDLANLEMHGGALIEPVDNLVDCLVEMSCLPPLP